MRSSFVFDANRCTGCQACQLACTIENGLDPQVSWRQIHTFNERRLPDIPLFHLSLACNHCAEPSCLEACPARAYTKDPATGAVLIDADRCIGCRYCSWACPYDAPRFDADQGVMTKCTFCSDRLLRGERPACAELCPTGALGFDALPAEQLVHEVEGFPRSDLGPAIRIVPLAPGATAPDPDEPGPEIPFTLARRAATARRVSLRTEWSLAVFTWLAAWLFAYVAAVTAGARPARPTVFLVAAAVGMALATLHLGRKFRAWRAMLGFARSWLSREIVFFSLFAASGALHLLLGARNPLTGSVALACGAAALFSMDRVYRFAVRTVDRLPHSAGVLLTGLFVAAVLAERPLAVAILGAVKLLLYVARKWVLAAAGLPPHPEISALRVVAGFGVPIVLWLLPAPSSAALAWASIAVAELIDRCEFYAELEFPSPARQMTVDLAARLDRA